MAKNKTKNATPMDERQMKERYRFGFQSFIITCIELIVMLVASMIPQVYKVMNEDVTFFSILILCLIIPLMYFNIMTKVCGVTNSMECILSIVIAVLYLVMLIVTAVMKNVTKYSIIFGILFVINGFIGLAYLINDKRQKEEDYKETHKAVEKENAEPIRNTDNSETQTIDLTKINEAERSSDKADKKAETETTDKN